MVLLISLLGEQVIRDDTTGASRTGSSRAFSILGLLVAHAGAPQSRQLVAGLLWPDSSDAQALTNLRRELHHLRRTLDDAGSLVVTSRDLCWRDTEDCRVDVRLFVTEARAAQMREEQDPTSVLTHATTALAAYGGDLLPAVYDEWVIDLRAQLSQACVALCDLTVGVARRLGQQQVALEAAVRRVRLHPLEEVGYRSVMELQADQGDRAGAISTYHQCASVLERELGVPPDPVTQQILQRLMRPASRVGGWQSTEPLPLERAGPSGTALVGRADELQELKRAWRRRQDGPRLVLVRGDAGVGKTHLVSAFTALARDEGATTATAQCFGTSGTLALAPVAEWLRHPAFSPVIADLDAVWRSEVERLVPAAGRPITTLPTTRAMVDGWQRHRFLEALARVLTGLGRPLVLVLDNVQWCDLETLSFLTFCLGFAPTAPLLVAGTVRDEDDADQELSRWVARMRAAAPLSEINLGPLDVAESGRLAAAVTGRPLSDDAAQLLHAMTGGFPLFVVEAARGALEGHPLPATTGLMSVLHHRLQQASGHAQDVAALAAAIGRDFSLDLLTEASDLEADVVVGAVDELWRRRIVQVRHDGYDFSHDLLRDAALDQVSPPRRWLMHRRLAQGLELLHSGRTDAVAAQLAEQFARSGRPERALPYFISAAEIAAGTFAHGEAIRLRRRALAIIAAMPPGVERDSQELSCLEAMTATLNAEHGYASPLVQDALERILDLAGRLNRRKPLMATKVGLGAARFVQGHIQDAYDILVRALAQTSPDEELTGQAYLVLGGAATSLGRPAEAVRHFTTGFPLLREGEFLALGSSPHVHGHAWAAHAHWLLGDEERAAALCEQAIDRGRVLDHPYSLAVALAYGAVTYQLLGSTAELAEAVAELRSLSERYSFAYYCDWGLVLQGWLTGGAAGVRSAQSGIKNLQTQGAFSRMPYWLSLLADLYERESRPEPAVAALDAALSGGQARDDLWWLPEVMRQRAHFDPSDQVGVRLSAATRLASDQGSAGLLRRCRADRQLTDSPVSVRPLR